MADVVGELRGVIEVFRKELGDRLDSNDDLHSGYTEVRKIAEELLSRIQTGEFKHITSTDSSAYTIGQDSFSWISSIHYKDEMEEKFASLISQLIKWKDIVDRSPKRPRDEKKCLSFAGETIDFATEESNRLKKIFDSHLEIQMAAKAKLSEAREELLGELGRELGWQCNKGEVNDKAKPLSTHSQNESEWIPTKVDLEFRINPMAVKQTSSGNIREVEDKLCFELLKFIADRGGRFTSRQDLSGAWEDLGGLGDGTNSQGAQLSKVRREVLDHFELVLENRKGVGWRVSSDNVLWNRRLEKKER